MILVKVLLRRPFRHETIVEAGWQKKMANNTKRQTRGAGFTLIELVITIAVFTIGIIAAFGLSLSNVNNARENSDRVVASNLAREGIELVRNIRDSNWLKVDANEVCSGDPCVWDSGILKNEFARVDYNVLSSGEALAICNGSGNITTCLNSCHNGGCRLYIDNINGFYTHSDVDAMNVANMPTNLSRAIRIQSICFKEGVPDFFASPMPGYCQATLNGSVKVGVKVTSQVRWDRLDKTGYFTAVDYLYNWRR